MSGEESEVFGARQACPFFPSYRDSRLPYSMGTHGWFGRKRTKRRSRKSQDDRLNLIVISP